MFLAEIVTQEGYGKVGFLKLAVGVRLELVMQWSKLQVQSVFHLMILTYL